MWEFCDFCWAVVYYSNLHWDHFYDKGDFLLNWYYFWIDMYFPGYAQPHPAKAIISADGCLYASNQNYSSMSSWNIADQRIQQFDLWSFGLQSSE